MTTPANDQSADRIVPLYTAGDDDTGWNASVLPDGAGYVVHAWDADGDLREDMIKTSGSLPAAKEYADSVVTRSGQRRITQPWRTQSQLLQSRIVAVCDELGALAGWSVSPGSPVTHDGGCVVRAQCVHDLAGLYVVAVSYAVTDAKGGAVALIDDDLHKSPAALAAEIHAAVAPRPANSGSLRFSMDGFRRGLSADAAELRKVVKSVVDGDRYDRDELIDAVNAVIRQSNVLNCVFDANDPDFSDLSHIEVEPLGEDDE